MPVVTPRFVDNAWKRGCDFINLDLEDSVPQHLKGYARSLIKDAIEVPRPHQFEDIGMSFMSYLTDEH